MEWTRQSAKKYDTKISTPGLKQVHSIATLPFARFAFHCLPSYSINAYHVGLGLETVDARHDADENAEAGNARLLVRRQQPSVGGSQDRIHQLGGNPRPRQRLEPRDGLVDGLHVKGRC